MCWILGLTGGAGSGKSTAADIFRELGLPIIDADRISRAVTAAGGAAVPAIRQAFGPEMIEISGAMNRARMRELVFRDPEARKKLEAIVHSAMKQVLDDEFACAKRSGAPFAVYDCPLLIESPQARARIDRILVIDVPEYLQVERLGTRSGLAPNAALRLIRAQTSRSSASSCGALPAAIVYKRRTMYLSMPGHARILPAESVITPCVSWKPQRNIFSETSCRFYLFS